ncbi:hypothetical protein SLEP1_g23275 [Rubroshorea leprosula]|uniref:Integrase catalytic domain-containing protein n=1 Tax=Rubroshorea leprosula TaxID=152421 RepID=A0AAV5JMS8_9ROSI|nr:hypothetical protein SLEP1_g23275 [Rubroshorea leprosula]
MVHTFTKNRPPRNQIDEQEDTQLSEPSLNDFRPMPRNLFVGGAEQDQLSETDDDERTPTGSIEPAWTTELEERTRVLEMAMGKILARLIPDDPLIPLLNRDAQPAAVVATRNSPTLSNIVVPTKPRGSGRLNNEPSSSKHSEELIRKNADLERQLRDVQKSIDELKSTRSHQQTLDLDNAPLNLSITAEPYQEGFKIPHLETYDGLGNPDEHLHTYQAIMRIQNANDAMMCKVFLATLKSTARTWYHKLPRHFIDSYSQLAKLFSSKFASQREIKRTATELRQVHQKEGESLRDYMQRFNKATLNIDNIPDTICLSALLHGLKRGQFLDDLLENPPKTWNEVNDRSASFILSEDFQSSKRSQILAQILAQIQHWVRRPPPPLHDSPRADKSKHCDYHRAYGHNTEDCQHLKDELEFLARNGKLEGYVQKAYTQQLSQTHFVAECAGDVSSIGEDKDKELPPRTKKIGKGSLQKHEGPIYRFDNQPPIEGVITLPIYVGSKPPFKMASVTFLVVKMESTFNAILGRATFCELKAVISQPHLCMKFPTPQGVGVLKGNQKMARACYQDTFKKVELTAAPAGVEQKAELVELVETVPLNPDVPEMMVKIGTKLIEEEQAKLLEFLRVNQDVFAWTTNEMLGIPAELTVHKLSIDPTKRLVVQKHRLFSPEKKPNGKWRMCIDFTNLNEACPKDPHPLPNMEKLVERVAGHERMSFLDASSGYHQVQLLLDDQEKTAFYVGNAIYCYVMMPFSLKNAGATYQKLVQIIFMLQIGRNIEVYVDDMIVTSCTFAVESGKFLRYVVSKKGIEVNPEKVLTIQQMEPPKTVKDVQRLTGRVAVLHRFIARSAERCLPFFKALTLAVQAYGRGEFILVPGGYRRGFTRRRAELPTSRKGCFCPNFKPKLSGRLIGWSVELSEYDLKFQSRTTIKGQAVADFLVECISAIVEEKALEHPIWVLNVDGTANIEGSKYEALIYGLKLASELKNYVKKCPTCQFNADDIHMLGVDLLGPFVKGKGGYTYLVVVVDYFTKWIEAKPLSTTTEKKIEEFLFNSILCKFGIPKWIIVDNGPQFRAAALTLFYNDYGIELTLTSVYTPQSNGQADSATGETPFSLAYGAEAVIPVEVGLPYERAGRHNNPNNEQLLRENLDLVEEVKEMSRIRNMTHQSCVAKFYNKRVRARQFQVGDLVLRKAGLTNVYSHMGKLAPNWEGPYMVISIQQPRSTGMDASLGAAADQAGDDRFGGERVGAKAGLLHPGVGELGEALPFFVNLLTLEEGQLADGKVSPDSQHLSMNLVENVRGCVGRGNCDGVLEHLCSHQPFSPLCVGKADVALMEPFGRLQGCLSPGDVLISFLNAALFLGLSPLKLLPQLADLTGQLISSAFSRRHLVCHLRA